MSDPVFSTASPAGPFLRRIAEARRSGFFGFLRFLPSILLQGIVLTLTNPAAAWAAILFIFNFTTNSLGLRVLKAAAAPSFIGRCAAYATKTKSRFSRALDLLRTHFIPSHAISVYWTLNDKFSVLHSVAATQKVDIWLANDWTTLPVVMRLSQQHAVPFAYDTHELAFDEYAQHLKWRLLHRPIISAVESLGFARAAFATCVSGGIANRLKEIYRLSSAPMVIRNTPDYAEVPFRSTGEKSIRVLYHGLVAPGRALEECIESVALWRPEFSLTIRGPATEDYLASLVALAKRSAVEDRIYFAEAVPMVDLIRTATEYDVGLFAIRDHSLQNTYVLPNKFFEYTMAGLALCVSDLPEMSSILLKYDLGELITNVSAPSIGAAINRLDQRRIDAFKQNSLRAARSLSWEMEGARLVEMAQAAVMCSQGRK